MPNADTADIRVKARRVKNHILTRYLKLADRVDEKGEGDLSEAEHGRYWDLTLDFAKNVIPRSQEITGEEGESIKMEIVKYADNPITLPIQTEAIPVAVVESI